jgi:predicted nucleic acid-binding protein
VIFIDANLLLYAYNANAPQHQRASHWLEGTFSGSTFSALSWQTIAAFIHISTNIRAFL